MFLQFNHAITRNDNEILFCGGVFCPDLQCINLFGVAISQDQKQGRKTRKAANHQSAAEVAAILAEITCEAIANMRHVHDGFCIDCFVHAINAGLSSQWAVDYVAPTVTVWNDPHALLCEDCFSNQVETFYLPASLNQLSSVYSTVDSDAVTAQCSH